MLIVDINTNVTNENRTLLKKEREKRSVRKIEEMIDLPTEQVTEHKSLKRTIHSYWYFLENFFFRLASDSLMAGGDCCCCSCSLWCSCSILNWWSSAKASSLAMSSLLMLSLVVASVFVDGVSVDLTQVLLPPQTPHWSIWRSEFKTWSHPTFCKPTGRIRW